MSRENFPDHKHIPYVPEHWVCMNNDVAAVQELSTEEFSKQIEAVKAVDLTIQKLMNLRR